MPEIHPDKISSYSSEDKAYPAANLLKSSSFAKWKSEKGGAKQEVVELTFEQPVEVCRLDIGNNGSAFIEVLVRRSVSTDDPTVFLPSSSFMSPVEAKNETNLTRVRVFGGDQFLAAATSQKWDVFRFVCTQPFNKTLQYGISFISFHTSAPKSQVESSRSNNLSSSVDILDENEESSELRPGALFRAAKANQSTGTPESTTPTSSSVAEKLLKARLLSRLDASTSDIKQGTSSHSASTVQSTSHTQASGSGTDRGGRSTISSKASPSSSHSKHNNQTPTQTENSRLPNRTPQSAKSQSSKMSASPSVSGDQASSSTPTREQANTRNSASGPLDGVVFSLSGYQNPLRSQIRSKALELGATCRQDWNSTCTHLICAFSGTPKFKEVRGKGIIVSDKWIERCYATKTRVNWRPYRVGRAPSPPNLRNDNVPNSGGDDDVDVASSSPDSVSDRKSFRKRRRADEDDDWNPASVDEHDEDVAMESESSDESQEDSDNDEMEDDSDDSKSKKSKKRTSRKPPSNSGSVIPSKRQRSTPSSADKKAGETQPFSATASSSNAQTPVDDPSDEGDTDDEIQRVMNPSTSSTGGSVQSSSQGRLDLPDLFEGKHFFIHAKDIPQDEERTLKRLIIAFAGNLHQYMHADVQFVVTRSTWGDEFDSALNDNSSLIFVRPDWILSCDQQAKFVPFQKFLVIG